MGLGVGTYGMSLDETDLEILRLLAADARRPYSEIADHVDLTPPAVSDRVSRLQEQGAIRGFTVDVDRSVLDRPVSVLVDLRPHPDLVDEVYEAATDLEGVEDVFEGVDGRVVVHATLPDTDVRPWLADGVDLARVAEYDVTVLARSTRNVDLGATGFALSCAVCDNEVGPDGVTATVDGERKHFCCPSCEARYVEQYETHKEALE